MIIKGTVTDGSDRPVVGAVVLVVAAPVPVPDIAALTGVGGRFAIDVPLAGDYRLLVRGDAGEVEVDVSATRTEVNLVIVLSG